MLHGLVVQHSNGSFDLVLYGAASPRHIKLFFYNYLDWSKAIAASNREG
ncbi:hypothetical protein APA_2941 [Pseudanabaena sp. lw0831]|nr:hypothetical protein APA_2941 [Pseudanabaena sp. lw0831]